MEHKLHSIVQGQTTQGNMDEAMTKITTLLVNRVGSAGLIKLPKKFQVLSR